MQCKNAEKHVFPFSIECNKPLSALTTFGIGGAARWFIEVGQIDLMQQVVAHCYREKIPYFVLGKGSNCLFDDRGFEGLVILNKIAFCQWEGAIVSVGAGYSFSLLGVQTARNGWTGLEFASGIPGSVGGAVYMNAGAGGTSTEQTLKEVSFVSEEGMLEILPRESLTFSYRTSPFQGRKGAIVAAKFALAPSEGARGRQLSMVEYRKKTQPYSDLSAGCVFRNPEGASAGALIQQVGLKGTRVGGAEVSLQHANFIVNREGATAADVLALVSLVKQRVKEETGYDLEMEVRVIPYGQ